MLGRELFKIHVRDYAIIILVMRGGGTHDNYDKSLKLQE